MSGDAVHDAYLSRLPPDQRDALARLRALLQARLPEAEAVISYGMPAFRQGKIVAGFAAFSRHCGFYPFSGRIIPALGDETAGYKTSKGGILFTPRNPLPDALVHRILDLRLAEIAGRLRD